MKIISLKSENVKCLRAVEIHPDGAMVVIGGKNAAGKSSVLDSIQMAMAGKGAACERPLRDGTDKGFTEVDIGDLIVRRTYTPNGGGTLTVKNKAGATYPSPQKMLDELVGALSFDPLAFSKQDPKAQAETIRKLVGVDFTAIDQRRVLAFSGRTEIGRQLDQAKAKLAGLPPTDDTAPAEEASAADLSKRLEQARDHNAAIDTAERQANNLRGLAVEAREAVADPVRSSAWNDKNLARRSAEVECINADGDVKGMDQRIRELEEELAECRKSLSGLIEVHATAQETLEGATRALEAQRDADIAAAKAAADEADQKAKAAREEYEEAAIGGPFDVQAIRDQINALDATNAKVRANKARVAAAAEVAELTIQYAGATLLISNADETKAKLLAAAKMPVEGLSFTADGVTLNGVPFKQASTAQQLRVSVAMGLAMNPKLRVLLIRDGSLLDDDSLADVARMAAEADAQVWVERVGKGEEVTVIIEDGSVQGDTPAAAP